MQQLQKPILNKLQPGTIPIFIIAPNKNDGEGLALLLSNNLIIKKVGGSLVENADIQKNYFSNADTRRLLPISLDLNIKKIDEYKVLIKLIIDEGFDSKKLWGLQIDYELFFDLQLHTLFPYATFIFLYGTKINKFGSKKPNDIYIDKVFDFYNTNAENSILLHTNNINYTPNLILQSLPLGSDVKINEKQEVKEVYFDKNENNLLDYSENYELAGIKQQLDRNNLIFESSKWYNGSNVIAIVILNKYVTEEILLNKIFQIAYSFIPSPDIHLICTTTEERSLVNSIINDTTLQLPDIKMIYTEDAVQITINEIINNTTSSYIIIDNLILSYSTISLLAPFKKFHQPTFVFGNLSRNKINEIDTTELLLVDMLTIHAIPDNIAFAKSTWVKINGFDKSLDIKLSIWDFCIRALSGKDDYALETDAITPTMTMGAKHEIAATDVITEEGYKSVIQKHKSLFEDNLNHVIMVASESQYLPQHEIVKLNYKISTLQSLLVHSKDELKSLNEQRDLLQNQINLLESRWYYKVAHKLSHFKKIFFKESGSGKSGILKVLKFIIFSFTRPGFKLFRKIIKGVFKKLYVIAEDRPINIIYLDEVDETDSNGINNYNQWIHNKLDSTKLRKEYNDTIGTLKVMPKISIIMPVYNPPIEYLKLAIESVIGQLYTNIELCIADDCSTNPQVKRLINTYSLKDQRIKVVYRQENGHISASSNSALALATGDYILCLDHDDLLTQNCAYEVVKYINENPDADVIYSDEDKIDDSGVFSTPYFKPDWAPDNLLAKNYITHIAVFKKELLDVIGGYRLGFEGSQDYDLILRATEKAKKIGHIPKVLYHWRIHSESAAQQADVKPYAFIAAKKALEEALQRRGIAGEVQYLSGLMGYRIKYKIKTYSKVSIIIPTKDQAKLMQNTIDSLISLTEYPNYEIIVLDNNSNTKEFFELMDVYKEKYGDIFRCIEAKFPFNFSKLMNIGVAASTGEYILLLNNDVEIIHSDWLNKMVSFAQQDRIGTVGVKLLYPDDKIQSAGTVIGLGGVAGHVFVNYYKDEPGYFSYLQSTTNYAAITAACLMVRRSVYDEVGGMEESLEVEFNDVDFCLKVLEKGYDNVYVPDVVLYHYESATRGHPLQNKVSYERHLREVKYFKDKWTKYLKRDPLYNPNLTLEKQDFSVDLKS